MKESRVDAVQSREKVPLLEESSKVEITLLKQCLDEELAHGDLSSNALEDSIIEDVEEDIHRELQNIQKELQVGYNLYYRGTVKRYDMILLFVLPNLSYDSRTNYFEEGEYDMNLVALVPTMKASLKLSNYLCILEGSTISIHDKMAWKPFIQVIMRWCSKFLSRFRGRILMNNLSTYHHVWKVLVLKI